jgi:hypothetical protein
MADLIKLNGNGMATSTGKQLLQIVPINIVMLLTVIGAAVGLYWKFDARIAALERSPLLGMTIEEKTMLLKRVSDSEAELKLISPRIIETHTNVLWLMNQQKGAHP